MHRRLEWRRGRLPIPTEFVLRETRVCGRQKRQSCLGRDRGGRVCVERYDAGFARDVVSLGSYDLGRVEDEAVAVRGAVRG